MTFEQWKEKTPAPEVCIPDADKAKTDGAPVIGEYITIPTTLYTELVRRAALHDAIIGIMTNKRVKYDMDKVTSIAAILDLPYEEGGDPA